MKVILLKNIPKVGKKYDIKDLSSGYALNLLIPQGLAQISTPGVEKRIEQLKFKDLQEKQIQGELLLKSLDTIKNLKLTLKEKANEKGHLFAGVTKEMLISEILKMSRLNLDIGAIKLPKPIKEIGEHKVIVEAMGKEVEFTLNIEAIL